MHLNEYLYANGEVVKLWLYPRGPDSGFVVYPGEGKRWGYFDTTPLAHALGEPCYVVQPHPPGHGARPQRTAGLLALLRQRRRRAPRARQGLAALLHRAGRRPVPGQDQGRARPGGARLHVHADDPAAPPRFPGHARRGRSRRSAPAVPRSSRSRRKRIDGFEGPIRVDIDGLPPGFSATTPLVIEAGQIEALGRHRRRRRRRRRPRPSRPRRARSRRRPRSATAT